MPEETAEQPENKPKEKSFSVGKLLLFGAFALVSSTAGGAVSWFLTKSMAGNATAAEQSGKEQGPEAHLAEALERGAVVPLDAFIVNLADEDAARYLRIKVNLMLADKTNLKEVEENQALQLKVRDVILQTLTQKTSHDLMNDEGKNKLRHEILTKIEGYFLKSPLADVMFTEFVIQL